MLSSRYTETKKYAAFINPRTLGCSEPIVVGTIKGRVVLIPWIVLVEVFLSNEPS